MKSSSKRYSIHFWSLKACPKLAQSISIFVFLKQSKVPKIHFTKLKSFTFKIAGRFAEGRQCLPYFEEGMDLGYRKVVTSTQLVMEQQEEAAALISG